MNPVISMSSKCSSEWNCDHTDIFTTCEEVNIRVKENSDNPFDTGCRKRQLLYFPHPHDHIQTNLIIYML